MSKKKFYENATQRNLVIDVVSYMIEYSKRNNLSISKETLNLICDRYCYVVDPPQEVGSDERYGD